MAKQTKSLFETIQLLGLNLISNLEDKTIDIKEIFVGIHIFESILEPFITGKMVLTDTLDLYTNFPLVGGEIIEMSLKERATNITRVFRYKIYKINRDENVMRGTSKVRHLEIFFCSEEMFNNSIRRISRKFSGNPVANIQWLLQNPLESTKQLTSVAPENELDYFANFHKPTTIINFFSRNSKGASGSDYLFFETMDGFTYAPISYLMQQNFVENMTWLPERDQQTAFRIDTIKLFTQENYFDHILNMEFGLFGKTLYKPGDNNRYGFVETKKTYLENTESQTFNGRYALFDPGMYDARNMVDAEYHDHDVKQTRSAMMSTILNNNKIVVRANGTLDRVAGNTLNVNMPNIDNVVGSNEAWDGKWLILTIRHTITPAAEYEQNLLLAKNARKNEERLPEVSGQISL